MSDCIVYIPYPVPTTISCDLCPTGFNQQTRHLMYQKHLETVHEKALQFTCGTCASILTNARSAARHECAEQPAVALSVRLESSSAVYSYPPGPSQCPLCQWSSQAKGVAAVTSIEHHLKSGHNLAKPARMWECSKCKIVGNGMLIRAHKCGISAPSPTLTTRTPARATSTPLTATAGLTSRQLRIPVRTPVRTTHIHPAGN